MQISSEETSRRAVEPTKGCNLQQVSETFQWYHHLHLLHNLLIYLKHEDLECMQKHSGSDPSGLNLAELLDALLARLPVQGSHTLISAERIKMSGKRVAKPQQRRRKRGVTPDTDTRPLNPSSSSTDPKPRTLADDEENTPDQMDARPLEPAIDENVSQKARVARNVLHIRGESELKFDVNEAWPNADQAIQSSYEGALIDGLPADKVKAGDEREIRQMKDLQLYSWIRATDFPHEKSILLTGWARRMKGCEVRSRCVLKDFAATLRDDVFAPTPSPLSVRGLLLYAAWFDLRVETGNLVCVLSCNRTVLLRRVPDLRKGKSVMDGSGDFMVR